MDKVLTLSVTKAPTTKWVNYKASDVKITFKNIAIEGIAPGGWVEVDADNYTKVTYVNPVGIATKVANKLWTCTIQLLPGETLPAFPVESVGWNWTTLDLDLDAAGNVAPAGTCTLKVK